MDSAATTATGPVSRCAATFTWSAIALTLQGGPACFKPGAVGPRNTVLTLDGSRALVLDPRSFQSFLCDAPSLKQAGPPRPFRERAKGHRRTFDSLLDSWPRLIRPIRAVP